MIPWLHHFIESCAGPEGWKAFLASLSDVGVDLIKTVLFYLVAKFLIKIIAKRLASFITYRQNTWLTEDLKGRARTISDLIRSVSGYALNFIFVVLLLRALRFDAVSVVSTASFAGLAFGFGAQKLVKDVINGFFLIMENQYAVGDYVTINTCTGKVEEIGMRIMKIRDDTGRLHILSNGDISQVTNMSRGLLSGVIELGAARDSDLLFIEQIVNREGEKLFQTKSDLCLAEAPKFSGVGALEFDHVIIKALVKVSDPTKLGIAQTALRSAYLKAIAEKPELLPE